MLDWSHWTIQKGPYWMERYRIRRQFWLRKRCVTADKISYTWHQQDNAFRRNTRKTLQRFGEMNLEQIQRRDVHIANFDFRMCCVYEWTNLTSNCKLVCMLYAVDGTTNEQNNVRLLGFQLMKQASPGLVTQV